MPSISKQIKCALHSRWNAPEPSSGPVGAPLDVDSKGFEMLHERQGDAHLSCDEVSTTVRILCNQSAPSEPARAIVIGMQVISRKIGNRFCFRIVDYV